MTHSYFLSACRWHESTVFCFRLLLLLKSGYLVWGCMFTGDSSLFSEYFQFALQFPVLRFYSHSSTCGFLSFLLLGEHLASWIWALVSSIILEISQLLSFWKLPSPCAIIFFSWTLIKRYKTLNISLRLFVSLFLDCILEIIFKFIF